MTMRAALLLLALGVLSLAGGWYFGPHALPVEHAAFDAGRLMFPELAAQLPEAARVEIVHQGTTLTIARQGDRWGLPDRGGYPVEQRKLRAMLTALTELRLAEPRTADPALYARIGVENPADKQATGDLVRVLDAAGKPLAALIVGHRRIRTQGDVPADIYVRRPDAAQSWLAEGSLEVDADPQLWMARDIVDIGHARIARIAVSRGETTLQFKAANGKLALVSPADHPPLDDGELDDLDRALEGLTFDDVRPAKPDAAAPEAQTVFTTNDGLALTVAIRHEGGTLWGRFSAAGTGATAGEAAKLNARLAPWQYALAGWREQALVPTLDNLKAAPPPPAPAAAAKP